MYLNSMECCGLREIHGISQHRDPEVAFKRLINDNKESDWCWDDTRKSPPNWPSNWRFAVFTQAGARSRYGNKFAAYIKANNLGEVIETATKVNPNSSNPLKTFVWTLNHQRVVEHAKALGIHVKIGRVD